jgi:hypothetical protein
VVRAVLLHPPAVGADGMIAMGAIFVFVKCKAFARLVISNCQDAVGKISYLCDDAIGLA